MRVTSHWIATSSCLVVRGMAVPTILHTDFSSSSAMLPLHPFIWFDFLCCGNRGNEGLSLELFPWSLSKVASEYFHVDRRRTE